MLGFEWPSLQLKRRRTWIWNRRRPFEPQARQREPAGRPYKLDGRRQSWRVRSHMIAEAVLHARANRFRPSASLDHVKTWVTGSASDTGNPSCQRSSRQRSALNPHPLSPPSAHPEQVEAPEGNKDQGARAYAQQQYNYFQHDRITPRWCRKSMRAGREIVIIQFRPNIRTKPFSGGDENILKQRAAQVVVKKTGTANVQFFFDLIWNQSRSRFLAAMSEREAEQ